VEGSWERGNEPSVSIKRWEVLEWLRNWQLLKKGSAPSVSERVNETSHCLIFPMLFSLSLQSKYSPQHFVLKHSECMLFCHRHEVSYQYKTGQLIKY
jgi:hypothetical protein